MHFDLYDAIAAARFAAAALDVEAESPRLVAAHARFGGSGKKVADKIEQPRIGAGIGAGRATDGRLVDVDHLIDMLKPLNAFVAPGKGVCVVQVLGQGTVERIDDQARFA